MNFFIVYRCAPAPLPFTKPLHEAHCRLSKAMFCFLLKSTIYLPSRRRRTDNVSLSVFDFKRWGKLILPSTAC